MMKISGLHLIVGVLLAGVCLLVGCNLLAYPLYLIAPSKTSRTIDAEFDDLDNAKVAVVIVASERLIHEHQYFRAQLAGIVSMELRKQLDDIKTVNPSRIVKHQDNNPDWDAIDRPALAKKFGADYLLQVNMDHYALRESGSQTLYRGNITAHAALFDASLPPEKARVWHGVIEVMYPKEGHPVARINNTLYDFRVTTERLFAENLVKKFRSYSVKVKQ